MVTDPIHSAVPSLDPLAQARRRRAVLVSSMRIVFCVAMVSVTLVRLLVVRPDSAADERELVQLWYLTIGLAAVLAAVFITIDLLTPSKKIATITGVSMGLLIGLLATVVVSFLMDLVEKGYGLAPAWTSMVKILLGISFCYLGVTIVLQTQDDFRLVIPYVEFSKQFRGQRPMLLDSSALIDARFVEVAQTGLIHAPIVIPSFVVAELQLLADSSDRAKRQRGRRGLDSIAKLQRTASVEVSLQTTAVPGTGVDQMLVELARQTQSTIVTTDTGLARVAAGAAGGLHQKREQALGGAEVGAVQRTVGVHRGHQRDLAEVVPLGEDLRAHQHVDVAVVGLREAPGQLACAAYAVGIEPGNARTWQQGCQLLLELLGAAAERRDVEVAALRAGTRHAFGEAAVVAAQRPIDLVEDPPRAAVRAAVTNGARDSRCSLPPR